LFTLYLLIQNTSHKYVYHLYADCDLQFSTDVCVCDSDDAWNIAVSTL